MFASLTRHVRGDYTSRPRDDARARETRRRRRVTDPPRHRARRRLFLAMSLFFFEFRRFSRETVTGHAGDTEDVTEEKGGGRVNDERRRSRWAYETA